MIEKATSGANIASMLQTLRLHQAQAAGLGNDPASSVGPEKTGFADVVREALGQVNTEQISSKNTSESFERGEDVPLTDVVLKMQKASLSFEATLQVRNKVLKAYEDVLNMPV